MERSRHDEELSAQQEVLGSTMAAHKIIAYAGLPLLAVCQLCIGAALLFGQEGVVPGLSLFFDSLGAAGDLVLRLVNAAFGGLLIILAVYAFLCQRALWLRKEFAVGQLYSWLFFCMIWIFAYGLALAFVVPYPVSALRLVDGVIILIAALVACLQYYRTRSSYFCRPASDSLLDRFGSVWLVFTRRPRTETQEASERNLKAMMAAGFLVFIALLLIWMFAAFV